jgi:hypothetical protein
VSALWILPLVVIAVGLVAVMVTLRAAAEAAVDLRREVAELDALRIAAADVRAETTSVHARWDSIRAGARDWRTRRSDESPSR